MIGKKPFFQKESFTKEIQIDEIKKTLSDMLREHEVKKAALFGSIVRGETTEKSDIDLLIEFIDGLRLLRQCSTRRPVHSTGEAG